MGNDESTALGLNEGAASRIGREFLFAYLKALGEKIDKLYMSMGEDSEGDTDIIGGE